MYYAIDFCIFFFFYETLGNLTDTYKRAETFSCIHKRYSASLNFFDSNAFPKVHIWECSDGFFHQNLYFWINIHTLFIIHRKIYKHFRVLFWSFAMQEISWSKTIIISIYHSNVCNWRPIIVANFSIIRYYLLNISYFDLKFIWKYFSFSKEKINKSLVWFNLNSNLVLLPL